MRNYVWNFDRIDIRYGLEVIDWKADLFPHAESYNFQILLKIDLYTRKNVIFILKC